MAQVGSGDDRPDLPDSVDVDGGDEIGWTVALETLLMALVFWFRALERGLVLDDIFFRFIATKALKQCGLLQKQQLFQFHCIKTWVKLSKKLIITNG